MIKSKKKIDEKEIDRILIYVKEQLVKEDGFVELILKIQNGKLVHINRNISIKV